MAIYWLYDGDNDGIMMIISMTLNPVNNGIVMGFAPSTNLSTGAGFRKQWVVVHISADEHLIHTYGGFLSHRATPSDHPFSSMDFPMEINHPAILISLCVTHMKCHARESFG